VDWAAFLAAGTPAEKSEKGVANTALGKYEADLQQRGLVDFTLLEARVLDLLKAGAFKDFTDRTRVLLVDEYQDTNLLQEQIYFQIADSCGGALTVVGDDDQSLYRFRGATVDLFSNFEARYRKRFGKAAAREFLSINYRFTDPIKDLVNGYATLDPSYRRVRVAGKPALTIGGAPRHPFPVLGMFEPTLDELARKLARFLSDVFQRTGFVLRSGDVIVRDPHDGAIGDCALLASTPEERGNPVRRKDGTFGPGAERFPLKLKEELAGLATPIEVFNPRGEDVAERELVRLMGGYLAELIDPGASVQSALSLPGDVAQTLRKWRDTAIDHHTKVAVKSFRDYAQGWANRTPQPSGKGRKKTAPWPRNASVLDLVYGIAHYFPELHDDPEGQLYLEVFTRQLTAASLVGNFGGELVHDPSNAKVSDLSIQELLRNFLVPIASGLVTVNEELIESFPRDRLSVLSIHQAKGLEFPLTIVDVGSSFKTNHPAHAFKRFPATGSTSHFLEELLRPFSAGLRAPQRSPVHRAFDDLYRQYFVAFSRPQDVLLLVGLESTLPGGIENVATGWPRTGGCRWVPTAPFLRI
jgi:DNA helicase-2/ATP-dependent DNA helicase PcrA